MRAYLRSLLTEEYGYPQTALREQVPLDSRPRSPRADLAVLTDGQPGRLWVAFFVETTEATLATIARDHGDRVDHFGLLEDGAIRVFAVRKGALRPLPHPPAFREAEAHFGSHLKSELRPAHNLKSLFRRIHNVLYGSSNMRLSAKLADELIKLVFCKIYDELAPGERCEFGISVPESQTDDGWRRCAEKTARLFSHVQRSYPDIFTTEEGILLDAASVAFVVGELEPFSLRASPADAVSAAFEVLLGSRTKGEKGEFFTPRPVVDAAVRMLVTSLPSERLTEAKFLDPAMGTGGFLAHYMEHVQTLIASANGASARARAAASNRLSQSIAGMDIEPEQVRIARAYLAILGNQQPLLFQTDSLGRSEQWPAELRRFLEGGVDLILTNPPFGTKIPIRDSAVLNLYDLARKWTSVGPRTINEFSATSSKENSKWRPTAFAERREQVPDILFLERCFQLLRPGGKMGIVLPRQILSGDDKQFVRQWIFDNCKIVGIVDLPVEAFQPFTGTKTSLVFLEKSSPAPHDKIFMAVSREVGHDRRGNALFRRAPDGKPIVRQDGEPEIANDLPAIVDAYLSFVSGGRLDNDRCFVCSRAELQFSPANPWGRLDAGFYAPFARSPPTGRLPKGWRLAPLGSLAKVSYPGRFKRTYVKAGDGIPFLSGNDATQVEPATKFVSKSMPNLRDYILRENTILVTRSGTVGNVIFVGDRFTGVAGSEHLLRVEPVPGAIEPGYLYAYLSSPPGTQAIRQGTYGSVVDEVSPDYVASIHVPVPPSAVQRRISALVVEAEDLRSRASKRVAEARRLVNDLLRTGERTADV